LLKIYKIYIQQFKGIDWESSRIPL
jgi:hypothetical protein